MINFIKEPVPLMRTGFLNELYMLTSNILLPALVGTSAMTLFSYLVSESKHENFREPDVLRQLIQRLPTTGSNDSAQLTGWGGHYATGLLFVFGYHQLWKQKKIKPSIVSGAMLGAASGLAGIIVWKIAFRLHPNPQPKNLNNYFRHLLFAHVVFGIFSALTYKLIRSGKNHDVKHCLFSSAFV